MLYHHSNAAEIIATRNGTNGRVYGGDADLIHIQDGHRHVIGEMVAEYLDGVMREMSAPQKPAEANLCPGCFMIALLDAAIYLARANGQPIAELASSMEYAYRLLALGDEWDGHTTAELVTEEIIVVETLVAMEVA